MKNLELIERQLRTKSGLLGKATPLTEFSKNQTTSAGTTSVKSWSSSNEKMAIAWCHAGTRNLGQWVSKQRNLHENNEIGLDRKESLDALDFVLNVEEQEWRLHHEKLVAFKRRRQRCLGPFGMALSAWVDVMRSNHANNKTRPDQKEILDNLEFLWKVDTLLRAHSSAADARGLVIGSLQTNDNCEEDSSLENRFKGPSPNRKLQSTCLAASKHMAANAQQRGNATVSCGSVDEDVEDVGPNEEDSKPSPANGSASTGSHPDKEVVVQEETKPGETPSAWKALFPI
jgi:hypothetical protein